MDKQEPTRKSKAEGDQTYVYRHAGIREREGGVPFWLILVCISLVLWSIYYTIRYWSEG